MSRVRFRFGVFSRIPDAGSFPQADHSNVRQNVPEASQAIWFGSRLADERKSFAMAQLAHRRSYLSACKSNPRAGLTARHSAAQFPRATDPRVFSSPRNVIRVIPVAAFRERKSSFGTIQSTSPSRTIRSSERNGS